MVEVLHAVLTPGATFIDLGANEGYFSVIASRLVGPKGTVIAVEPQLRLQAILQTNFYLNECFNIRLIRAAVSGHANEVRLELSSDMNPGASSLYRRTKYPLRKETVKSFSLGKLLELTGLNRCDLMKVDVEGAEFEIFTEADDALRSGALRNLAVEFHEPIFRTRGICGQELDTRILSRGYVRNDIAGNRIYSLTS
jgi:FkbM family methyltransferase